VRFLECLFVSGKKRGSQKTKCLRRGTQIKRKSKDALWVFGRLRLASPPASRPKCPAGNRRKVVHANKPDTHSDSESSEMSDGMVHGLN